MGKRREEGREGEKERRRKGVREVGRRKGGEEGEWSGGKEGGGELPAQVVQCIKYIYSTFLTAKMY